MKLFVILSLCLTLVTCQFNGLLSPPASEASYSSGYGNVVGNNEIASAIKLAEYSSNGISNFNGAPSPVKQVPIPAPQPYSATITKALPAPAPTSQPHSGTITKAVPVSAPIPNPVNIPRPIPVLVPPSYPIPKPFPIPITRPLFINIPQPVQVPIAQPYPVVIPQHPPIRISTPLAIPLPITAGIFGGGDIFSAGIPALQTGGYGNVQGIEGIGKYPGEFGGGIIDGGGFIGVPSGQLTSGGFSGSGSFSNIDSERYGGRSFVGDGQGNGQVYDSNGGYKY